MQLHEVPDAFQSKIRIVIVSALLNGEKSFKELKEIVGTTDGNLSRHLTKLIEEGFVSYTKQFKMNRPLSKYNLSAAGKQQLIEYIEMLNRLVENIDDKGGDETGA